MQQCFLIDSLSFITKLAVMLFLLYAKSLKVKEWFWFLSLSLLLSIQAAIFDDVMDH